MTNFDHPLRSLREGRWFKLICGASFQHLPAVRNLTLAYALAGADCIDVAADPAVIAIAQAALDTADQIAIAAQHPALAWRGRPWLMVSLNDGEDPHFRKAEFNPALCPPDCPRPCETICPAQAIVFKQSAFEQPVFEQPQQNQAEQFSGVIDARCYGCGRCLPICPIQQITTRAHVFTPEAIAPLVLQAGVDALEIHTQVGRLADFQRLWRAIAPWAGQLKLLAISCPDGEGLIDYLWSIYETISPLTCALVWQTDGRPMSGDIGDGATRAAVKLGQKVLAANLPGFVQLAGGTNRHTVEKLASLGLLAAQTLDPNNSGQKHIAGVAYGSYARVSLSPVLDPLETLALPAVESPLGAIALAEAQPQFLPLEAQPDLLWQAVELARSLVGQIKSPPALNQPLPSEAPAVNSIF
uniref:circadian clock protein LdpA n=1 Tax=Trichocoleus desertorum TaxID=1481672 RepID=UPI0025B3ED10|nr:LdpA C-terminal domain-containing domain [Trichocoleus desertorum]